MNIPEGWQLEDNALNREFKFKDFAEAFAFMAEVAVVAEAMQHHPDWRNSYNRVSIRLTTHDKGGVTDLDVDFAKRCNNLLKKG